MFAWVAYLFVLPFHRVWTLPWFGDKLQPPEVAFVALVIAAGAALWRHSTAWRLWRPTWPDLAVLAWVAANVVALFWSASGPTHAAVIETLGAVYLAGLYLAVRLTATDALLDRYGAWVGWAGVVAAAAGIVGVVLASQDLTTRLATISITPVPYIGTAARAKALTTGPQMLASILLIATPLFVAARLRRTWRPLDSVALVILLAGLVATVSKTALCVTAALAVMWVIGRPANTVRMQAVRKRYVAGVVAAVAILFVLGSHIMVARANAVGFLTAAQLVAGEPLLELSWRDTRLAVMPTTYYFNKRTSVEAISRTFPIGTGPGGQPAFAAQLQREGTYPSSLRLRDPHSSYLGPVAELGALGLLALSLFLTAGVAAIRQLLSRAPIADRWEVAAFAGVCTAVLIEATSTDLFNCRHYWFFFAVLAARYQSLRDRWAVI
jgi:hypothetical protein